MPPRLGATDRSWPPSQRRVGHIDGVLPTCSSPPPRTPTAWRSTPEIQTTSPGSAISSTSSASDRRTVTPLWRSARFAHRSDLQREDPGQDPGGGEGARALGLYIANPDRSIF